MDCTAADELSGRREVDIWRFTHARSAVPRDWADVADAEKRVWIDRAKSFDRMA